jgi:DmsE family decaheme c-type cytochrome
MTYRQRSSAEHGARPGAHARRLRGDPWRSRASRFLLAVLAVAAVATEAAGQPATGATWSETDCQACHGTAVGPAFQKTAHAGLTQSCATCHDDVADHLKAQTSGATGGPVPSLKRLPAATLNAKCLTCHETGNRASFAGGMHARRNVACTSCHSVHAFKSKTAQLKTARDPETCYTCHQSMRAKALRTSHHPVREGKMGCSSCHNPHDGANDKMTLRASVNETCYVCHTEKRGPFLYEHAPVRENCVACHDPHGSNHERLLVAKQPFLCQRCHFSGHGLTADNASSLEGLPVAPAGTTVARSTRNTERGCKQCHLNIHGSNSPSGAYFVR